MTLLHRFLDPSNTSLKICGVTRACDAGELVALGVDALGVNFWPQSKRYLAEADAQWLLPLAGQILRVGVFVNAEPVQALRLWRDGLIDAIQLHGDESPDQTRFYRDEGAPCIKAVGVENADSLKQAEAFGADALLLDAHAPGVYGGTGIPFDWQSAVAFKTQHPRIPVILAGGIVASNARMAADTVQPCALDVASGAEISPGIKDLEKVKALLRAIRP